MAHNKWTIVAWNAAEHKFLANTVRCSLGGSPGPQRSPSARRQKPKRSASHVHAVLFRNALAKRPELAPHFLEMWTGELPVELLERCALALARRSGGLGSIPATTRSKLEKYGLLAAMQRELDLDMELDSGLETGHSSEASAGKQGGRASTSAGGSETAPLLFLASHPHLDAVTLQRRLANLAFVEPQLQSLAARWTRELADGPKPTMRPVVANFSKVLEYVPRLAQCQIAATVLARYAATIAVAGPPKSVSSVCCAIGDKIAAALLARIAAAEGETSAVYMPSDGTYLWHAAGLEPWNLSTRLIVGAFWVQAALKYCKVTQVFRTREVCRPAFLRRHTASTSTSPSGRSRTRRTVLAADPRLVRLLSSRLKSSTSSTRTTTSRQVYTRVAASSVTADKIPPLVPPHPWVSFRPAVQPYTGSLSRLRLIASASAEGRAAVAEAIRSGAALPQLNGLNRLQSQAWRINRELLGVVRAVRLQTQNTSLNYRATVAKEERPRDELRLREALAIADALGDREFYLPMYMDFRGRCYAASRSRLNYMGNDEMRALFVFAEAKPLGSQGLFWLEVHLANLYGACKSQTFAQRRAWVSAHRAEIAESAKAPLTSEWWRRGARPFQVLAACIELGRAWAHAAGAARFASALPVQLDGTSNGLQHLTALARDATNAEAVNLAPNADGGCGDVYRAAGEALTRSASGSSGKGIGASGIGGRQSPPLARSLLKQAVMTFFYGASPSSIAGLLKTAAGGSGQRDEASGDSSSGCVAEELGSRLAERFRPERRVQNWLVECARRIVNCRSEAHRRSGPAITWTSPLGLPVVQPYVEPRLTAVRTAVQTLYVPSSNEPGGALVERKQIAGVVANVVHSLDAAHMLATARGLPREQGFAAVHDSFWTQAGRVHALNAVLRRAFAEQYSRDVLVDLRAEWLARYAGDHLVLGMVHADSVMHARVVQARRLSGYEEHDEACLAAEFSGILAGTRALHRGAATWVAGVPHLGTPGLPHVKAWFRLQLDLPPSWGEFDAARVLAADYFFS